MAAVVVVSGAARSPVGEPRPTPGPGRCLASGLGRRSLMPGGVAGMGRKGAAPLPPLSPTSRQGGDWRKSWKTGHRAKRRRSFRRFLSLRPGTWLASRSVYPGGGEGKGERLGQPPPPDPRWGSAGSVQQMELPVPRCEEQEENGELDCCALLSAEFV